MPRLRRILPISFLAIFVVLQAPEVRASAYDAHPKLVVLVVIDQFRGEDLDRYRADFTGSGFSLFLDRGAYFEDCYYDYANTETAPGHATLGTGAYSNGHGIASNSWWDLGRNKQRRVTSVEDERYHLVGLPAASSSVGASPLNLRASTLGDSLRLATQGQAKVFGVALKDDAAILPAGYSANGAFWIDPASGAFLTSSYYMTTLPDWAVTFNTGGRARQAREEVGVSSAANFYQSVGRSPAANSYELDFARALITGEQLGEDPVTDMLVISLSANRLGSQRGGADSPQEEAMVDNLDQQLDSFFTWLDKNIPGGLANVWVALSADHGVAPAPAHAAALGLPTAAIDVKKLSASLNQTMNDKFSPGEKIPYLLPQQRLPYLALNQPSFQAAGINEQEAEQAVQQALPAAFASLAPPAGATLPAPAAAEPPAAPPADTMANQAKGAASGSGAVATPAEAPAPPPPVRLAPIPTLARSYTREQLASGELPPTDWGRLVAHSYSPNGGWYVMAIPAAFQEAATGTAHVSPWSYDRHVPLAFYGAPFTPGLYYGRVQPVDLAATLASLLGINQPSASVGQILTQAIRKVPAPAAPHAAASHRRGARARAPQ